MSPTDKNRSKQERAALAEKMRKEREKAARRQRNVITSGIVIAVVIIGGLAAFAIKHEIDKNNLPDVPYAAPKNTQPDAELTVRYDAEAAGATPPAGAQPVDVEIYEDFQCPACQAFFANNGAYLDDLVAKGEIDIVYHPVPILDRVSTTEYASRAANAAACVLDQTDVATFRAFGDLLFANQPAEGGAGLSDSELIALAKEAGADGVTQCVEDRAFAKWAAKARSTFGDSGYDSTPTVVVDGKEVHGPTVNGQRTQPTQTELQKAIDAAKA